ncbi:MAG: HAD-IIA family hydrolase [Acidimicrobiia bacterium]|nr:HAD-IIA family hydrolase [Acidimicrobiia bacterium]
MIPVICDLDGVVYVGDRPVPRAPEALERLKRAGRTIVFATNNSTRTPGETAEKITRVVGVQVQPEEVVTSAQAAATLLEGDPGPAVVVGGAGIRAALEEVGIAETTNPAQASVVVVGMDRDLTYGKLVEATTAIRNGARFVATNDDATYPSPAGPLPGAGAVVAAIETTTGIAPQVAGKPHQPMRALLKERVGEMAWVVGDRWDTDIALATEEPGWQSILVLTGEAGANTTGSEAQHIAADLFEAVEIVTGAPLTR